MECRQRNSAYHLVPARASVGCYDIPASSREALSACAAITPSPILAARRIRARPRRSAGGRLRACCLAPRVALRQRDSHGGGGACAGGSAACSAGELGVGARPGGRCARRAFRRGGGGASCQARSAAASVPGRFAPEELLNVRSHNALPGAQRGRRGAATGETFQAVGWPALSRVAGLPLRRCCPPPAPGSEGLYELVGDLGRKNGAPPATVGRKLALQTLRQSESHATPR